METVDRSLTRLGEICAYLVSAMYILLGVLFWLLPPEQRPFYDFATFFPSFAAAPTVFLIFTWALAFAGLFALVAARSILDLMRPLNDGGVISSTYISILGYVLGVIDAFRVLAIFQQMGAAYSTSAPETQAAMTSMGLMAYLDPTGILKFGGVGVWILLLSALVLRRSRLPAWVGWIGVALGVMYFAQVAGAVLNLPAVFIAGVTLTNLILAPAWYLSMARSLKQSMLPGWDILR
jgi:hypothetical protein